MMCPKCDCESSFHNSGEKGYPRIMSLEEILLKKCGSCGHHYDEEA